MVWTDCSKISRNKVLSKNNIFKSDEMAAKTVQRPRRSVKNTTGLEKKDHGWFGRPRTANPHLKSYKRFICRVDEVF